MVWVGCFLIMTQNMLLPVINGDVSPINGLINNWAYKLTYYRSYIFHPIYNDRLGAHLAAVCWGSLRSQRVAVFFSGYVLALSWIPMEQTACRTICCDLPGGVPLIRVVFLQNGVEDCWRLTWKPKMKWRFGRWFSFSNTWWPGSMLIF